MGAQGHLKVPQIGRVIIQDDVEIGANTTIDRGASRDTVIGEGTKIDNLVQIGHNVDDRPPLRHRRAGRHLRLARRSEDFVVLGGQVGVVGHVRIGMGAQIAAVSNVDEGRSARRALGRHSRQADARLVPRDGVRLRKAAPAAIRRGDEDAELACKRPRTIECNR